jgi:hypothetical protein
MLTRIIKTYQTSTEEECERVSGIDNEEHRGQTQRMHVRSVTADLDCFCDVGVEQISQRLLRAEGLSSPNRRDDFFRDRSCLCDGAERSSLMLDHELLHGGAGESDGNQDRGHGQSETPFLGKRHWEEVRIVTE